MEIEEIVRQLRQSPHRLATETELQAFERRRNVEIAAADLLEEQADQIAHLRDKIERLEWRVESLSSRLEQQ